MAWTEGNHLAKITGHALGKTGTGKPQIAVEFEKEIKDGEGNISTESLTWYGYFTENARSITIDALIAMGWDAPADGYDLGKLHNTGALIGNECRITVKYEADLEGEMRPKIAWVNKAGVAIKEELPADEIAGLVDSMKGDLAAAYQGVPSTGEAKTEVSDEDIPF